MASRVIYEVTLFNQFDVCSGMLKTREYNAHVTMYYVTCGA